MVTCSEMTGVNMLEKLALLHAVFPVPR